MKMPGDLDPGGFVDQPGWYHMIITHIDESPVSKKGTLMDGIKFSLSVLASEHPSQVKRVTEQTLFNGDASHADGGEFADKRQCRMARALEILPKAKPGEDISIPWQDGRGRQVIMKLKKQKEGDFLEVDGAQIYHVADEEVADKAKDANAVALMKGGKPVNGNGGTRQPAKEQPQQTVAAAASSGGDDFNLDDL